MTDNDLALLFLAVMVLMTTIAVVPVDIALALVAVMVIETEVLLDAVTTMMIDVVIDLLPEPVVLLMTTHHHVAGLKIHTAVIIPQILTLQTGPVMIEAHRPATTHQEIILLVVMTDALLIDYDPRHDTTGLICRMNKMATRTLRNRYMI